MKLTETRKEYLLNNENYQYFLRGRSLKLLNAGQSGLITACIVAAIVLTTACKNRASDVKGIDAAVGRLLDINTVSDAGALKEICTQDTFILFVGNAEKLGSIEPNPNAKDKMNSDYIQALVRNDTAKEKWYFAKIKSEYEAFKQKMSKGDEACAKHDEDSRWTILAILDGPDVGDSMIEVSTYSGKNTRSKFASNPMVFDTISNQLKPNPSAKKFELFMPRDLPQILTVFRDSLAEKSTFKFALNIIKGHGVTVQSNGKVGLLDILEHKDSGDFGYPMTVLDTQDENGGIPNSQRNSLFKIPMWSPETLCLASYGSSDSVGFKACVNDTLKRLQAGFDPSSIGGCRNGSLERLAQSDIKQGDIKQGDIKQGDIKQGDTKQGAGTFLQDLNGIDYGPNAQQGGKGFAVPGSLSAQASIGGTGPEPSAFRVIGSGLALSKTDGVTSMDLPIPAQRELTILDSCNMDGRKAELDHWYRNRPGKTSQPTWQNRYGDEHLGATVVLLMNPFPVSADAVEYGALSLQQYFLLNASLGRNSFLSWVEKELPFNMYLDTPEEVERRNQLSMRLQANDKGMFKSAEEIYCSLYALVFACDSHNCHYDHWANVPLFESVESASSGFQTFGLLDAVLTELRNHRLVPDSLLRQLDGVRFAIVSNKMSLSPMGLISSPWAQFLSHDFSKSTLPVVNKYLIRFFESLRTLIIADLHKAQNGFDPMRMNLLTVPLHYDRWNYVWGGTPPVIEQLLKELDYKTMHEVAVKQGATKKSLEEYQRYYEGIIAKLLQLETKFITTQKKEQIVFAKVNPDVVPAFSELLQAFIDATSDTKDEQHK